MADVVPSSFLFRFSFPIRRDHGLPKRGPRLLDLPSDFAFPDLSELRGERPIGELRIAWNDEGLGLSLTVHGKHRPPDGDERSPTISDGLQVWLDTRNTQSIHRASRFCHHFCMAPLGGGRDRAQPFAVQLPIAQARESPPFAAKGALQVKTGTLGDGYWLEAWLRRDQLHGFDPAADRETGTPTRLGFYCLIRDNELGDQPLTVDESFPFAFDPSLWVTLECVE